MVECVVEYEYTAEEEDELTLKVGDVVHNVVKMDGGWWEGEINGKKGVFPDNFVKERKVETKPKEGPGKKGNVEQLASQLKAANISNPPKRMEKVSRKTRAKVTFSYTPENNDEIELVVGDIVEILNQEEEGWWEGKVNGRQGVFPSNFVEVIENEAEPEPVPEPEPTKPKKVRGVGFGNIFEGGPIQLKKANKHPPNDPPRVKEHKVPPKKTEPVAPPVPKEAPAPAPKSEPPKGDHCNEERSHSPSNYDMLRKIDEESACFIASKSADSSMTTVTVESSDAIMSDSQYTEDDLNGSEEEKTITRNFDLNLDLDFDNTKQYPYKYGLTQAFSYNVDKKVGNPDKKVTPPTLANFENPNCVTAEKNSLDNLGVSDGNFTTSPTLKVSSLSPRFSASFENRPRQSESGSSEEIPLEMSSLSNARETPPPRVTFRKRRSKVPAKSSPATPLHESTPRTSEENPPLKRHRSGNSIQYSNSRSPTPYTNFGYPDSGTGLKAEGAFSTLPPKSALTRPGSLPDQQVVPNDDVLKSNRKIVSFITKDTIWDSDQTDEENYKASYFRSPINEYGDPGTIIKPIDIDTINDSIRLAKLRLDDSVYKGKRERCKSTKFVDQCIQVSHDDIDETEMYSANVPQISRHTASQCPTVDGDKKEETCTNNCNSGSEFEKPQEVFKPSPTYMERQMNGPYLRSDRDWSKSLGRTSSMDKYQTPPYRGKKNRKTRSLPRLFQSSRSYGMLSPSIIQKPPFDTTSTDDTLDESMSPNPKYSQARRRSSTLLKLFGKSTKTVGPSPPRKKKTNLTIPSPVRSGRPSLPNLFFGRGRSARKEILPPMDETDQPPEDPKPVEEEETYFKALKRMNIVSPAIKNICKKYRVGIYGNSPEEELDDTVQDTSTYCDRYPSVFTLSARDSTEMNRLRRSEEMLSLNQSDSFLEKPVVMYKFYQELGKKISPEDSSVIETDAVDGLNTNEDERSSQDSESDCTNCTKEHALDIRKCLDSNDYDEASSESISSMHPTSALTEQEDLEISPLQFSCMEHSPIIEQPIEETEEQTESNQVKTTVEPPNEKESPKEPPCEKEASQEPPCEKEVSKEPLCEKEFIEEPLCDNEAPKEASKEPPCETQTSSEKKHEKKTSSKRSKTKKKVAEPFYEKEIPVEDPEPKDEPVAELQENVLNTSQEQEEEIVLGVTSQEQEEQIVQGNASQEQEEEIVQGDTSQEQEEDIIQGNVSQEQEEEIVQGNTSQEEEIVQGSTTIDEIEMTLEPIISPLPSNGQCHQERNSDSLDKESPNEIPKPLSPIASEKSEELPNVDTFESPNKALEIEQVTLDLDTFNVPEKEDHIRKSDSQITNYSMDSDPDSITTESSLSSACSTPQNKEPIDKKEKPKATVPKFRKGGKNTEGKGGIFSRLKKKLSLGSGVPKRVLNTAIQEELGEENQEKFKKKRRTFLQRLRRTHRYKVTEKTNPKLKLEVGATEYNYVHWNTLPHLLDRSQGSPKKINSLPSRLPKSEPKKKSPFYENLYLEIDDTKTEPVTNSLTGMPYPDNSDSTIARQMYLQMYGPDDVMFNSLVKRKSINEDLAKELKRRVEEINATRGERQTKKIPKELEEELKSNVKERRLSGRLRTPEEAVSFTENDFMEFTDSQDVPMDEENYWSLQNDSLQAESAHALQDLTAASQREKQAGDFSNVKTTKKFTKMLYSDNMSTASTQSNAGSFISVETDTTDTLQPESVNSTLVCDSANSEDNLSTEATYGSIENWQMKSLFLNDSAQNDCLSSQMFGEDFQVKYTDEDNEFLEGNINANATSDVKVKTVIKRAQEYYTVDDDSESEENFQDADDSLTPKKSVVLRDEEEEGGASNEPEIVTEVHEVFYAEPRRLSPFDSTELWQEICNNVSSHDEQTVASARSKENDMEELVTRLNDSFEKKISPSDAMSDGELVDDASYQTASPFSTGEIEEQVFFSVDANKK